MRLPWLCTRSSLTSTWTAVRQVHHVIADRQAAKRWKPFDTDKLRNIGVIAHIDAGKTTTTERMLYISGASTSMGNVDSGDTTTDYLNEERQRGITINSAAVSFDWRKHRVNLIDTPGHVDFSVEVERSLRVMDGCVLVLDGSAGVEAQSLTVWQQCRRYHVPAIVFVNKMDKPRADFAACLDSIESLLNVTALPVFIPEFDGDDRLVGVTDVLRNARLTWSSHLEVQPAVQVNTKRSEAVSSAYETMLDKLVDHDDELADMVLAEKEVDVEQHVISAIRRATIAGRVVPVACGSSLHNVGVNTVLDSVVQFLPSPLDQQHPFGGDIIRGSHLYNVTQNSTEPINHLYVPHANQLKEVTRVSAGSICVIAGLKHSKTGDTLAETKALAKTAATEYESHADKQLDVLHEVSVTPNGLCLMGIDVHEPVFFCTIEPERLSDGPKLDKALQHLSMDDPSLNIRVDSESGQLIMETQGELHMEVVRARLKDEYRIEVFLGEIQISYKEVPIEQVEGTASMDETFDDRAQYCNISIRLIPSKGAGNFHRLKLSQDRDTDYLGNLRADWLNAIRKGCALALMQGPLLHNHVIDVDVMLLRADISFRCTPALISACASRAVANALHSAKVALLEPVMMCELITSEHSVGTQELLSHLTSRRAHILQVSEDKMSALDFRGIKALVPLSELTGFSNLVRKVSSGTINVNMHRHDYWQLDADQQAAVITKLTGKLA